MGHGQIQRDRRDRETENEIAHGLLPIVFQYPLDCANGLNQKLRSGAAILISLHAARGMCITNQEENLQIRRTDLPVFQKKKREASVHRSYRLAHCAADLPRTTTFETLNFNILSLTRGGGDLRCGGGSLRRMGLLDLHCNSLHQRAAERLYLDGEGLFCLLPLQVLCCFLL